MDPALIPVPAPDPAPAPEFVPLKRRRSRRRMLVQKSGVAITSVVQGPAAEEVRITFARAISYDGVGSVSNFMAFTSDGFMDSALDVIDSGADWIVVEFNGTVSVGAAWQVVGALEGFAPAVAWPQGGVVEE